MLPKGKKGKRVLKSNKNRGFAFERELVNLLESNGYAAIRCPASGGGTKKNRPDVLAGNGRNIYAFEVKSSNGDVIYIHPKQIKELYDFADKFGALPWVCVRFTHNPFTIFNPRQLQRTPTGKYKIWRGDLPAGIELTRFLKLEYDGEGAKL